MSESVFFEKTYQDAVHLLERTHGYAQSDLPRHLERMEPLQALYTSTEIMRVTARLTQVMAWLMAQKAAAAGEISFEEACDPAYCPNNDPTCINKPRAQIQENLPSMVCVLLEDSHRLYVRVAYLASQHAHSQESEDV